MRFVLDPLAMKETYFPDAASAGPVMPGYTESGSEADYLVSPLSKGTGSMRSNAADMIKYLSYLQKKETPEPRRVLTLSSLSHPHSPPKS